ncbi:MAG TPA: ABC transporter permease [Pseudomonadota bacterium]|nr:ABC transporter permease [Pseudomonadota bacterium]HNI58352.1 ABC transporter permease [Pseudomonadota bacterium]HNK45863.1 ABC transporter permease [Pseudomonadota bacterium]HNN54426.1 ABC transporter permease [Pseudomonadota bacterium]HNO67909.1 ABC transporter permease [Pseudomonadota bacterium]
MATAPPHPPASPKAPGDGWFSSLWPRRHELLIAGRYLFRRAPSRGLVGVSLALLAATAVVESLYFLVPGWQAPQMAIVALLLPVVTVVSGLLNILSVFSTVAVLGVMLGVAALTVVMAVTSGFQAEIRSRVVGLNAHVLVLKYGIDFHEYEETLKKCQTHPSVVAGSPFVYNEMLIAKEGALTSGVLVKGIDAARANAVLDLTRWLVPLPSGQKPLLASLDTDAAPSPGGPPLPGLFLGQELARKLKAQPGDKLRLISPQIGLDTLQGADPSQAAAPRSQEFRLAGVFSSGFDEYDRRLVLTGLRPAQQLVGQGDVVTGLELRTQSVEQARQTGGEVISLLGGAPYRSLDWEELNHNLFTALAMQKAVLSLVLFLIILVAAFNIVASLTMMVIDKTREVAILKAMGMSSASVSSLFRVAGMAIGSLGVSLGLSLGVLTCKLIERLGYLLDAHVYMIERLPTKVSGIELVITGSVTILISLLATVYPSVRAARLHPVDGLRYD